MNKKVHWLVTEAMNLTIQAVIIGTGGPPPKGADH